VFAAVRRDRLDRHLSGIAADRGHDAARGRRNTRWLAILIGLPSSRIGTARTVAKIGVPSSSHARRSADLAGVILQVLEFARDHHRDQLINYAATYYFSANVVGS
jgi:hypothetical protein